MAVVNRFNVNKQQVTLDADIIENMSANDISYNSSLEYGENTVGYKLSELEQNQMLGGVYDVTTNNDGLTFSSLTALLSSENLSTLIPVSVRYGGMTIQFIQSSDNKYVQYRLTNQSWSSDISDWQEIGSAEFSTGEKVSEVGIDDIPTAGSNNLVKSGGIYEIESTWNHAIDSYYINLIESWDGLNSNFIEVLYNHTYKFTSGDPTTSKRLPINVIAYNANKIRVSALGAVNEFTISDENIKFVVVSEYNSIQGSIMVYDTIYSPTKYLSHDDSLVLATDNEIFNGGIEKIFKDEIFPSTQIGDNNIAIESISQNKLEGFHEYSANAIIFEECVPKTNINDFGKAYSYQYSFITGFFKVVPNTVIISSPICNGIAFYKQANEESFISKASISKKNLLINVPEEGLYARASFYRDDGSVDTNTIITNANHIQRNGDEMIDVGPTKLIESIGDNLVKFGSKIFTLEEYNLMPKSSQKIYGNIDSTGNISLINSSSAYGKELSYYIPVTLGDEFTAQEINYSSNEYQYNLYDIDYTFISTQTTSNRQITITDENAAYMIVCVGLNCVLVRGLKVKEELNRYRVAESYKVGIIDDFTKTELVSALFSSNNSIDVLKHLILYPNYYGKKWAVLGDSITNGTGTSPYCNKVAAFFGLNHINYGIIGSQIAKYSADQAPDAMCERYVNMASDADIISVMGGINDSYDNIGAMDDRQENGIYTLYSGAHKLFSGLIDMYPGKLIFYMTSPQSCRNKSTDDEWGVPDVNMVINRAKMEAIKEVAHFYGIPVFDVFNESGISGYTDTTRAYFFQSDKLHLTQMGQDFMADRIIGFMKQLI